VDILRTKQAITQEGSRNLHTSAVQLLSGCPVAIDSSVDSRRGGGVGLLHDLPFLSRSDAGICRGSTAGSATAIFELIGIALAG
jgi:hypothetical protein